MTFEVGSTIVAREVLHGETWLELHETVVSDDGRVLATVLTDGTPLTHHPEHPFGPHPWSSCAAWVGPALARSRVDGDQLRQVLDAAATVTALLDDDDRWWAPWDSWSP